MYQFLHADSVLLAYNGLLRYSEALHILYSGNTFHFRGGPGLLAFAASISNIQWTSIRHVHLSTLHGYNTPPCVKGTWPPENVDTWDRCCQKLEQLPRLQSLSFDITIQHDNDPPLDQETDHMVRKALDPLRRMEASSFIVEINSNPSPKVWEVLGHVNFTLVVKEREQNVKLYGTHPMMEIGDMD